MSIEYRIHKTTELMTYRQLQNDWGVDNWELIGFIDNRLEDGYLYYHFKR